MLSLWRRRKWLDVPLAAAATAIIDWRLNIRSVEPGTFYQICGGEGVGVVAFVIAPVATLLTLSGGTRFQAFNSRYRSKIIDAMSWSFSLSLLLLMASAVGGISDDKAGPVITMRVITLALACAAALATARLFWFFVAGLRVVTVDGERDGVRQDH